MDLFRFNAKVSRYLEEESFGLVFGENTFIALAFQTLLTITVVSNSGLSLDVRGQYTVYAFYYSGIYFLSVLWNILLIEIDNKSHKYSSGVTFL